MNGIDFDTELKYYISYRALLPTDDARHPSEFISFFN